MENERREEKEWWKSLLNKNDEDDEADNVANDYAKISADEGEMQANIRHPSGNISYKDTNGNTTKKSPRWVLRTPGEPLWRPPCTFPGSEPWRTLTLKIYVPPPQCLDQDPPRCPDCEKGTLG